MGAQGIDPSKTGGAVAKYEPPQEPWNWSNEKKMNEWTTNDVKDYMHSLTYTETTRNVMKNQISGKDLLLARTPEQLAEKLGIPVEKAEGIFEILQIQKQQQMFCKQGADEKQEKDPNANFMGSQSWKRKDIINWTPYNVKSWFASQFGGKVDGVTKKKVLDAIDEYVLDGSKLSSMEDASALAALFKIDEKIAAMIYSSLEERISGEGGDEKKDELVLDKEFRFRKLQWAKYKFIKLSSKKDCIMGYTDDDDIDRAEMSCGHAIAADTMFYYIKSILDKSRDAVFIICPVPDCDTEWDWNTCLRIADMDDEEITKYNAIRAGRRKDIVITKKRCPNCYTPNSRPEELSNFRVSCTNCKGGDWCFGCEQTWKNNGNILCGNKNCSLVSGINDILQNCPMKKVAYLDCQIPQYRACPTCLAPIEHLKACKHMKCKARNCGTEFCFICLAVKDDKSGWPKECREGVDKSGYSHRYECKYAPRQYFV